MRINCAMDWYDLHPSLYEECRCLYIRDTIVDPYASYHLFQKITEINKEVNKSPLGFKKINEMIVDLEKEIFYEKLRIG